MANSFQDLSQVLANLKDTIKPSTVTANTNGDSIDIRDVGTNRINARLSIGAVSGTTPTLDVKMQASPDGTTWTDITGATFTQKDSTDNPDPETINFDVPTPATVDDDPYIYVRAVATVGGTTPSYAMAVSLLAGDRWDGAAGWANSPPSIN